MSPIMCCDVLFEPPLDSPWCFAPPPLPQNVCEEPLTASQGQYTDSPMLCICCANTA